MKLSKHHFRCLYTVARTGSIEHLIGSWTETIQLLSLHGMIEVIETVARPTHFGYELLGWRPIEDVCGWDDVGTDVCLWMPGPEFDYGQII